MKLPQPLGRWFDSAKKVYQEFGADNGGLVAAAVSFFVFLSLVPMLLLAIAATGFFLGSPERAQALVMSKLQQFATVGTQSAEDIRRAVAEVVGARGVATGISLLALLWTGTSTVTILEEAMNVAWDVNERRGFVKRRLIALLIFAVVGALLGLSAGLTALLGAIRGARFEVLGFGPGDVPFIWSVIGYLVPVLFSVAAFTAIYKILPYTAVPIRHALLGGVFAGVCFEAAKLLFTYYVTHFADYTRVYGSLGGVILLMVWINYTAVITILGAELIAVKQGRQSHSRMPES